jgi:hypothetical protein
VRHAVRGTIGNVREGELDVRVVVPMPSPAEHMVCVSAGPGARPVAGALPDGAANATSVNGVLGLVVAVRPV